MELIDFYYYNLGEEPDEKDRSITKNTFEYLKDNNYSDKEIVEVLKILPAKTSLSPSDLPDSLWNNSLLKKDTFYFHNELHITSKAPYWDLENEAIISSRFFLEMKIQYTVKDLIKYFYRNFPTDNNFIEEKKDIGAIEYLLKKYKNLDFIEPVDFILYLIDQAVEEKDEVLDILELKRYEKATFEYLKLKTQNAAVEKVNKIIWR